MQQRQQGQVRLAVPEAAALHELPQVLVEMAVIIIAVQGRIKIAGRMDQVCRGLADTHHLQGLLAADAGAYFKITLQGAGGKAILSGQLFHRNSKPVVLETLVQYITHDRYGMQNLAGAGQLGKK